MASVAFGASKTSALTAFLRASCVRDRTKYILRGERGKTAGEREARVFMGYETSLI